MLHASILLGQILSFLVGRADQIIAEDRAREAHFIELLRGSLPRVNRVMVVGGAPSDAWETLAHFVGSTAITGIDPAHLASTPSIKMNRIPGSMSYEPVVELSVAPGGFSDFVLNRRVIDFLEA